MVAKAPLFGVAVGGLAVGCAVGLALASLLGTSPSDAARSREVPVLPTPTALVERQQLREVARAACEPEQEVTTVIAPGAPDGRPLVVTEIGVTAGDVLTTGTLIGRVSGRPLISILTEVPFYRDLDVGDTGDDVQRLETALVQTGALTDADAVFDDRTAAAIAELYRRAGVDPSLLDGRTGRFALSLSHSIAPGSAVLEVLPAVGDVLQPGDTIASVGSPDMAAACSVTASVQVSSGDPVALGVAGGQAAGTVRSVGPVDSESMMRTVVVVPDEPSAYTGGPVDLELVTNDTAGDVLTVPAGALFTAAGGGFEVRKVTPDGYEVVPVELGMAAGGFVEVRSNDLAASDEVHLHASLDPTLSPGHES